jgi:hypothetical protein
MAKSEERKRSREKGIEENKFDLSKSIWIRKRALRGASQPSAKKKDELINKRYIGGI